jgi:hypothetical protein
MKKFDHKARRMMGNWNKNRLCRIILHGFCGFGTHIILPIFQQQKEAKTYGVDGKINDRFIPNYK